MELVAALANVWGLSCELLRDMGALSDPAPPSWLSCVAKRPTRTKHSRGIDTQPHCWEADRLTREKQWNARRGLIDRWMD